MFIRATPTKNKVTGTVYIKHQLVESVRTPKGPRQRIVMELGTLDLERSEWKKLSSLLSSKLAGEESFFDDDPVVAKAASLALSHYDYLKTSRKENESRKSNSDIVPVDLNIASSSYNRSLGPELVGIEFFKRLGFDDILRDLGIDATRRSLTLCVRLVVASLVES